MNAPPPVPPSPERAPPDPAEHDVLAPGTRFGEFEILRVLGVGGFGIVYLAMDHSLQREVALKEYMPAALAVRGAGPQITIRSGSFAETYAIGLRSFVNEARLLARFDHPSLVKVYRFWEDNATAYMVMPYLQGRTLRDVRREIAGPPDETWLRGLLDPLLGAIEVLHREGVYHRDIAPDNILLPRDGPPILLDFGAARRVISDRTQTLTAILKPSYAPIEQYANMTQLRQGPWTDLYAVGAVLHFALVGAPPPPATARALDDELVPLAQRHFSGVSQRFLLAIDWALAVRPVERPQSVEALRAALQGRAQVPQAILQRAAAARTPAPNPGDAHAPTLHLGGGGSMPTQADTTHQPTMPLQPTVPMQVTLPMQATMPMQPTVPMSAMAQTQPIARTPAAPATPAYSAPNRGVAPPASILTPLTASAPVLAPAATPARQGSLTPDSSSVAGLPTPHSTVAASDAAASSRRVVILASIVVAALLAGGLGWKFGALREHERGAAVTSGQTAAPTLAPAASATPAAPAIVPAAVPVVVPAAPPAAVADPVKPAPSVLPPQARPAAPATATPPRAVAPAKPVTQPAAPAQEPAATPYGGTVRGGASGPVPGAPSAERAAAPPAVVPPAAVAPPATAASEAQAAPPAEPKTAREACGKRVLVALWQCMERECEKPRYRSHPQCVEALNTKRAREGGS